MKRLNKKGFTLIELLAVIVIMGILMIVAIPAISRTIENSRKDTFLDTAKNYASSVKTMWASDSLECRPPHQSGDVRVVASGLPDGTYYVSIDSSKTSGVGAGTSYPILLESGGKSSWGNKDVKGYIKIVLTGSGSANSKVNYYVYLSDGTHGISEDGLDYVSLKRGHVLTTGVTQKLAPSGSPDIRPCFEI